MKPTKNKRWKWSMELYGFKAEAWEHINPQCIEFSISINWNFRPSIEIGFLFWSISLEYYKHWNREK